MMKLSTNQSAKLAIIWRRSLRLSKVWTGNIFAEEPFHFSVSLTNITRADRMDPYTYLGLQLLFGVLSSLLNGAGLIAISSYEKKSNQNLILAFLSVTEIVSSLVLCIISLSTNLILRYTCVGLQASCVFMLVLNMILLTTDRYICLIDPLKYRSRFTRKKLIVILASITIISIINGLYISIARWFGIRNDLFLFIGHALNVGFILFSVATYILAFYKAKKSAKKFRTNTGYKQERTRKIFLVPGIIIATYMLFYSIPNLVNLKKVVEFKIHFNPVFIFIPQLGFIVDPLTYIFLCGHYRKAFLKRLQTISKWSVRSENHSDVTDLRNEV